MRIVEYNKTLKDALEGSKEIYEELEAEDFDDEEIAKFEKIKLLSLFHKDLLYLYSLTHNVAELGRLYKVSTNFVRKELKKINEILA